MKRSAVAINLAVVPAFAALEREVLDSLHRAARLYQVQRGQMLYHQGDQAHSFYVVQQGGVRLVEHTGDGQTVHLKLYGPGDLFGLLAISGAYPYPAGVQAIDDSHIAGISGAQARDLMLLYPTLGLCVVDLLVAHVHHAHGRIRQLSSERVERRLARALLVYSEKFGRLTHTGSTSIDIALTQQDMAEFIGTTLETINRTLRLWEKQGYVRLARQHVDIVDLVALTHIAEDLVYVT
ncbi:MAG: Crp/Fnr family transcriptional regulator [Anaerolineae bacterium]|jgi:CRP-like cAMP-binding protein|nr:Crp/Fnr family transcriptional regulator [Anaerolineae bacterium]